MDHSNRRHCFLIGLAALFSLIPCLVVTAAGANFGGVSGTVRDSQGNPLMGATVLITGPLGAVPERVVSITERVITDAHGKFAVEHLIPGLYSLRVTSPARLPAVRDQIRVEAGQTTRENFVLTDFFSALRFKVPAGSVSNWGNDWKWVLRTSATTRPILRYRESVRTVTSQVRASKSPLPSSRRLIGMIPGSTRRDALADDPGLGSVLAYLRPLSEDSDILVAGSMTPSGLQASSLATAFRKNLMRGDPQELALVVHQLSFPGGSLPTPGREGENLTHAQGVVASYAHTRRLADSLTLTAGLEVDYLNAVRDVVSTHPRMKLEYQLGPSTSLAIRYGTFSQDGRPSTLLDRISMLNAFPRVTLRNNRPRLEEVNHSEFSVSRQGKSSRLEVAAYRDSFRNAAVLGDGREATPVWLNRYLLPSLDGEAATLNAGDYASSGLRATYSVSVGSRVEAAFLYTCGQALAADASQLARGDQIHSAASVFRPARSQSFGGRVLSRIPVSNTQVVTSYEWLQHGRVTVVDPYGQASLELQPYLGIQIRQPLPTLAFLPAHIEALADFRNLLGQGYVPISRSEAKSFLLTSAYRSIRGGFSVQF